MSLNQAALRSLSGFKQTFIAMLPIYIAGAST